MFIIADLSMGSLALTARRHSYVCCESSHHHTATGTSPCVERAGAGTGHRQHKQALCRDAEDGHLPRDILVHQVHVPASPSTREYRVITRPYSRQRVTNQCKASRNSNHNHTFHHKQHNYANKLRHSTQENSILTCAYDTRVNILNCGAPTTQSGGDRCACQAIATGSINTIS